MLELKITIAAPDLAAAINNLAVALANGNTVPAEKPAKAEKQTEAKDAAQQAPVNPMRATGAPLSATPAQTAAQIAPAVPVVQPAPVANTTPAPTAPTSAPQYTLDMIATAGSALIDAGKMDQLMQLLGKFGVASLTELAPESYGAVAGELRALGATI